MANQLFLNKKGQNGGKGLILRRWLAFLSHSPTFFCLLGRFMNIEDISRNPILLEALVILYLTFKIKILFQQCFGELIKVFGEGSCTEFSYKMIGEMSTLHHKSS